MDLNAMAANATTFEKELEWFTAILHLLFFTRPTLAPDRTGGRIKDRSFLHWQQRILHSHHCIGNCFGFCFVLVAGGVNRILRLKKRGFDIGGMHAIFMFVREKHLRVALMPPAPLV
jgi:hypothetical protein